MKFDNAEQLLKAADDDGLRRVLVVTALALELKAVMAHLKLLGSCTTRDGNVFEFGKFSGTAGDWLVVVGESGAGNTMPPKPISAAKPMPAGLWCGPSMTMVVSLAGIPADRP